MIQQAINLLESALIDLKMGDDSAISSIIRALDLLGVDLEADEIDVGNISDAEGVAIGNNIRIAVTQEIVALPDSLNQRLTDILDAITSREVEASARRHIRIFLSSPGDVSEERALAMKVIENLPYDPLLRGRVSVEVVAWDRPGGATPMLATLTPQEAINQGLAMPSECDIVVTILWSRMGTPLSEEYRKPEKYWFEHGTDWEDWRYFSGTEWEYVDAMQQASQTGRPLVVVYRRTEEPQIGLADTQFDGKVQQYRLVEAFFTTFTDEEGVARRGVNFYETPSDFEAQFELHLRDLFARLIYEFDSAERADGDVADVELWTGSPFPGLRAFGPKDAPIFFGRGPETDDLVELVRNNRFVAVVGASGSGKSSLVGAGLLPRLANNAIPGSQAWPIVRFTPDELGAGDPFASLAAALRDEPFSLDAKADSLINDPNTLATLCEAMVEDAPEWAEVLIFVDQFEELFTRSHQVLREPFVAMLEAAVLTEKIRVVVTLRADFYDRALQFTPLESLIRGDTYPLYAPRRDALRDMIERPAERAGITFERGLVGRILDDTGDDPGALALLAFALERLYQTGKDDRVLSFSEYEAFGGVQGGIGQQAQAAFEGLDKEAQDALPVVFRELVEVDAQGTPTRRRVELAVAAHDSASQRLIKKLTAARLLVQSRGEGDIPTVEVAHEALFRSWDRLAQWIDQVGEDLRQGTELLAQAQEWQAAGEDQSYILRGIRLEAARYWLDRAGRHALVNALQERFIQASHRFETERAEAEERRRRREVRRLRAFIGVLAVITLLAAVLGLAANRNAQQARGLSLETNAVLANRDEEYELAALLSIEALENYPHTEQATNALANSIEQSILTDVIEHPALARKYQFLASQTVALSPDRTRLAVSGQETIYIYDLTQSQAQVETLPIPGIMPLFMSWNQAGNKLGIYGIPIDEAIETRGGVVMVWDFEVGSLEELGSFYLVSQPYTKYPTFQITMILLASSDQDEYYVMDNDTHRLLSINRALLERNESSVFNLPSCSAWSISPDSTQFVCFISGERRSALEIAPEDRLGEFYGSQLLVYDLVEYRLEATLEVETPSDTFVSFPQIVWSPDGQYFFLLSRETDAFLYDSTTYELLQTFETGFTGVYWSPDSTNILITKDNLAQIRDLAAAEQPLNLFHIDSISTAEWSSNGELIMTGGINNTAVWDAATGDLLQTLHRHAGPITYAGWIAESNTRIVTVSSSETRLWDISPGGRGRSYLIQAHDEPVVAVAYNAGGTSVGSAAGNTIRIWNALTGELQAELADMPAVVTDIAFHPLQEDIMLVADVNGTAHIWDTSTRSILLTVTNPGGPITSVAFNETGEQFATGGKDGTVLVWDTDSGAAIAELIHVLPQNFVEASTRDLPSSPMPVLEFGVFNEDVLVVYTADATVTSEIRESEIYGFTFTWDAETWELTEDGVSDEPFPDKTTLATASAILSEMAWTPSGELVEDGQRGTLQDVAFNPARPQTATGSSDGTLWLRQSWGSESELIETAKECCVHRDLTLDERLVYDIGLTPAETIHSLISTYNVYEPTYNYLLLVVAGTLVLGILYSIRRDVSRRISDPGFIPISHPGTKTRKPVRVYQRELLQVSFRFFPLWILMALLLVVAIVLNSDLVLILIVVLALMNWLSSSGYVLATRHLITRVNGVSFLWAGALSGLVYAIITLIPLLIFAVLSLPWRAVFSGGERNVPGTPIPWTAVVWGFVLGTPLIVSLAMMLLNAVGSWLAYNMLRLKIELVDSAEKLPFFQFLYVNWLPLLVSFAFPTVLALLAYFLTYDFGTFTAVFFVVFVPILIPIGADFLHHMRQPEVLSGSAFVVQLPLKHIVSTVLKTAPIGVIWLALSVGIAILIEQVAAPQGLLWWQFQTLLGLIVALSGPVIGLLYSRRLLRLEMKYGATTYVLGGFFSGILYGLVTGVLLYFVQLLLIQINSPGSGVTAFMLLPWLAALGAVTTYIWNEIETRPTLS